MWIDRTKTALGKNYFEIKNSTILLFIYKTTVATVKI